MTTMKIAPSTDERTHLVDVIVDELQKRGHEVVYFGPERGPQLALDTILVVLGGGVARHLDIAAARRAARHVYRPLPVRERHV